MGLVSTTTTAPAPSTRSWTRPETWLRWGLTVAYLLSLAGLATTLGGSIAPWLGWIVAALGSGIAAAGFWRAALEHQGNLDRLAARPPDGARRFSGGTSLTVGPGRDAPHPDPEDDDESGSLYP